MMEERGWWAGVDELLGHADESLARAGEAVNAASRPFFEALRR